MHALAFSHYELPVWSRRLHHVCESHKWILGELFNGESNSDPCKPMPFRVLQLRILIVPVTVSSSIQCEPKFSLCRQPYWSAVWRLPPQLHSVH